MMPDVNCPRCGASLRYYVDGCPTADCSFTMAAPDAPVVLR